MSSLLTPDVEFSYLTPKQTGLSVQIFVLVNGGEKSEPKILVERLPKEPPKIVTFPVSISEDPTAYKGGNWVYF